MSWRHSRARARLPVSARSLLVEVPGHSPAPGYRPLALLYTPVTAESAGKHGRGAARPGSMLRRGPRRLPVNACPALGLAEAVRPGSTEDPGPAAAVKTGEELAVNHAGACRGVMVPRPRQPRLVTLTTIRRSSSLGVQAIRNVWQLRSMRYYDT